ncbi:hypothetical protein G8S55_11570 [Clostridium botulinum C]|uniref:hypothetical protein n=1 Tax=Clostridium botulinum TaxID=1491 RepID=UPI001E2DC7C3|nr:hypothetical protein [Clostridium botulinum]MCD3217856.1 hypothetical protein [Clostridium botulinum C]
MLTRTERGELSLESFSVECFFDSLFQECKNKHELDWLEERLKCCLEVAKEDYLDQCLEDLEEVDISTKRFKTLKESQVIRDKDGKEVDNRCECDVIADIFQRAIKRKNFTKEEKRKAENELLYDDDRYLDMF